MENDVLLSETLERIKDATDSIRETTGTVGETIEDVATEVESVVEENASLTEQVADLEEQIEEITPVGNINLTENGSGIDIAHYATATVDVSGGIEGVYKVSSVAEMEEIENPQADDICIVEYMNTTYTPQDWTEQSIDDKMYFPETVVLSEPFEFSDGANAIVDFEEFAIGTIDVEAYSTHVLIKVDFSQSDYENLQVRYKSEDKTTYVRDVFEYGANISEFPDYEDSVLFDFGGISISNISMSSEELATVFKLFKQLIPSSIEAQDVYKYDGSEWIQINGTPGVYKVSSVEEMDEIQNPHQGDYCIVDGEPEVEIDDWTVGLQSNSVYFPNNITLDEAFPYAQGVTARIYDQNSDIIGSVDYEENSGHDMLRFMISREEEFDVSVEYISEDHYNYSIDRTYTEGVDVSEYEEGFEIILRGPEDYIEVDSQADSRLLKIMKIRREVLVPVCNTYKNDNSNWVQKGINMPTETINIANNGSVNVLNYATANVNVSSGTSGVYKVYSVAEMNEIPSPEGGDLCIIQSSHQLLEIPGNWTKSTQRSTFYFPEVVVLDDTLPNYRGDVNIEDIGSEAKLVCVETSWMLDVDNSDYGYLNVHYSNIGNSNVFVRSRYDVFDSFSLDTTNINKVTSSLGALKFANDITDEALKFIKTIDSSYSMKYQLYSYNSDLERWEQLHSPNVES